MYKRQVQALLKRDTRTAPRKTELHLFSGFLRCADCGKSITRSQSGKNVYYACSTYKYRDVYKRQLTGCALSMSCRLFKIRNSTARAVSSTMASGSGKNRRPRNSGCGWPLWRLWKKSPPTLRPFCGSWRRLALR